MEEDLVSQIMEAVKYIKGVVEEKPTIGIILGSGLGALAYEIQDPIMIPYKEIPYFKSSNVPGHEGQLVFGTIYNKYVVCMQGRLHYYEGYSMEEIVFPVRVLAMLGVETLIATNAAGGIDYKNMRPGDFMIIKDHINLSGNSPLRGPNVDILGTRFPSMKNVYTPAYRDAVKKVAQDLKFTIHEGVYAYMPGPQYETDAEIKMLETLGASAVGMSTVPEVIAAAHSCMNVIGISCITNISGPNAPEPTHEEVLRVAQSSGENFVSLILDTIREI